jgi:nicotinamidase/pyrazinamidase
MLLRPFKGIIIKRETIFLDVDTQSDFMRPEGRLYVAGAEGIIDNVSEARRFALANGYSVIAATDWHRESNEEISDTPDFKTTFPPHCMAGKPGSERVGYLGELPIDVVPNERISDGNLRKLVDKSQFHIVIRKEAINAFSNPNTATLVEILKPRSVVIFGVALDLCIRQVVDELSRMGSINPPSAWKVKLYVLWDAVKALGFTGEDEVMMEFRTKGVEIISVADLETKIGRG